MALGRPPGTFSPEAVQVPKPSFLGKESNFDGSGAGTSAPSESPTESEEATASTLHVVDDADLRQQLEEGVARHLQVLPQQSLALNALQSDLPL